MTGYGKRETAVKDTTIIVELRSVNHRFLEVAVKLPRALAAFEDQVRKAVQQRCLRGRVDVTVSIQNGRGGAKSIELDAGLAKQYHQALKKLQKTLGLKGGIDLSVMAGFRDILSLTDQPLVADDCGPTMLKTLGQALGDLEKMRTREGLALSKDLEGRLKTIGAAKETVAQRAPKLAQEAFDRMKERVQALLGSELPDLPRLHQELAVFADRSDISEELVRLESHMLQFDHSLKSKESIGKTLEFLLQEMGREVNTIGSKANDAAIAALVVQMKAELEKLREQVQNVE
ncbi:MAG: YicC family protein [Nitrospiraceae bacterium]|nr:YicC family protein [Nitrospiraceae bacterium]